MSTILFYESAAEAPTEPTALAEVLTDLGVVWEAPAGAPYRPGRWRDARTGARCLLDLGEPPLGAVDNEGDDPPTSYAGWRLVPLAIHLPLAGPHWQAVETIAWIARLVEALPGLTPLDTEDNRISDEADAGPYPLDRPRLLISWERQREGHLLGRTVPTLGRAASIALWRYRRERGDFAHQHAGHHWPEATVLLDRASGQPHTACLWLDGEEPLALPPVDLVVVQGAAGTIAEGIAGRGCLPADLLRALPVAAPAPAGAVLLPGGCLGPVLAGRELLPVSRFAALGDEDWAD